MKIDQRKNGTTTSSFGSPGRINHDSSQFYNSRLYEGLITDEKVKHIENKIPSELLNKHFCHSSESMNELPNNSVHLMITSPPYNVTKEYDNNLNLEEYVGLLNRVWRDTYRVLAPGGRACINVANLGRKPYIPLHSYIIEGMLTIGFLMRGEIIWNKASSASPSTAWGSWLSAANPVLRDIHEYNFNIFKRFILARKQRKRKHNIKRGIFRVDKKCLDFSCSLRKKIGHPAPFPEELPTRLIKLYSFKQDVILDPFLGSGTTSLSAIKNGRNYVGYDTNKKYIELANKRVAEFANQTNLFQK